MKSYLKKSLLINILLCTFTLISGQSNCDNPLAQSELDINGVRARLLTGGDLWGDGADGRYIVPKQPPGVSEISAFYTAGIWIAGKDGEDEIRLAAQTYGRSNGRFDYYSGPLNPVDGSVTREACAAWDRIFSVERQDIQAHIQDFELDGEIDADLPNSIERWPGSGNAFYAGTSGYEPLFTGQPMAPFFDRNDDGIYQPELGDYPLIKGDEAHWWVNNDFGNIHRNTNAPPVQMEIQTLAFAESTSPPALNLATFYEYKLYYRGSEPLDSFYLSLWTDPDLGCFTDDFVGSIPSENVGYVYNGDATDLSCSGTVGYDTEIPVVGIKMLERPQVVNGATANFSSFMYFLPANFPIEAMQTPTSPQEYYNYMAGRWRDGSPLTQGGNGYQSGEATTAYAFPGDLAEGGEWTECSAGNQAGDRRFMMNYGPLSINPGDEINFCFAVVTVEDQPHPCPSTDDLLAAIDTVITYYEGLTSSTEGPPLANRDEIAVFPNPVRQQAFFRAETPIVQLAVYSINGVLVQEVENSTPNLELSTADWPAGIYIYKAQTLNGRAYTGKLIVE